MFFAPDKRFTFDARRPVSTSGEFVEAWLHGRRRPNSRQIFNHVYETRELAAPPMDDAAQTEKTRPITFLWNLPHPPREDEDVPADGVIFRSTDPEPERRLYPDAAPSGA